MTIQGTGWKHDLLLALCATLLVLGLNAISGFPTIADLGADNDSMLRLVEVRDLLAGQGWFDLHQYRMGLTGGFVMHWSRLVD
ncbi:MAG: GtrA family protein, partial [Mesorhizobium sp.]